jgi:hypothetical protein
MIIALLLQAITPQSPPYAIYATLAVGLLSLIASCLNIYFSSQTAQKVVNLSTKTTREVAELSAQVSRESAGLAAKTAKEIKDQDYKHDFYKKIIEKRFKAWEEMTALLSLSLRAGADTEDNRNVYLYFMSRKRFYEVFTRIDLLTASQIMWMSDGYVDAFAEFQTLNADLSHEAGLTVQNMEDDEADDSKLVQVGKDNYDKLETMMALLLLKLHIELFYLHDVEKFLNKYDLGL